MFTPGTQTDYPFNEFSAISDLIKRKLDDYGHVELLGIGHFTKAADNSIGFTAATVDEALLMPVDAKRVVREDANHPILVGDKETMSAVMAEILAPEEEILTARKYKWWIWAAALAAIGLLMIALYIYEYGFNNFASNLPF